MTVVGGCCLKEWMNKAVAMETITRTGVGDSDNARARVRNTFVDFGGRLISPVDMATNRTEVCMGDRVLKSVQTMLKKLDRKDMFPRSQLQKELHNLYTGAEMHHIYGKDFEVKVTELKMRLKVPDFHPRVGVSMPRRFGKTQSVGQHDATMLACMKSPFVIGVFSQGSRASKLLLKLTYSIMVMLDPESDQQVEVNNAETLMLRNADTGVARTMNSYPGGVRFFPSILFSFSLCIRVCVCIYTHVRACVYNDRYHVLLNVERLRLFLIKRLIGP